MHCIKESLHISFTLVNYIRLRGVSPEYVIEENGGKNETEFYR